MLENQVETPKLPVMRRTAKALGNDKLHKTINWTTLIGVAGTAVVGYLADGQRDKADTNLASGTASELAVFQEWKEAAQADLRSQAEQIARLREAVAALKAANDIVARGYGSGVLGDSVRAATGGVGRLLDQTSTDYAPAEAPVKDQETVKLKTEVIMDKLLGKNAEQPRDDSP
jgi:hypothetical protein